MKARKHPMYKWAAMRRNRGQTWITKDRDSDKVPNIVDCEPSNPRKQGFISYIAAEHVKEKNGWLGKKVEQYQEYKAKRPERERARIEDMKRRVDLETQRAKLEQQRAHIRKLREQGRPKQQPMSTGLGLFGSQPFGQPAPAAKKKVPKKTPRKRKGRKKGKGRSPQYIVRGGKAYPIV